MLSVLSADLAYLNAGGFQPAAQRVDADSQLFGHFHRLTALFCHQPHGSGFERIVVARGAVRFFVFFCSIVCSFAFQFTTLFSVCQFGYGGSGLLGSRKAQVGGMLCGRQAGTGKPIRGSVSVDRGDVFPGTGLERSIARGPLHAAAGKTAAAAGQLLGTPGQLRGRRRRCAEQGQKLLSLNQKQALNAVFLDGRLELTNNLAERTVKPFVMVRRNFLFCDTAKDADASALCFSVIETAKRNGLDFFGYLLFLLQELPKLGENPSEEQLIPLLPWTESLPTYCKLKSICETYWTC